MSMDLNSLLLLHLGKRGYEYVFIPPMAVGQLEALYYLDDKIFLLGELPKKKNVFFWEISPKSVYPPTHPRIFVRFGRTKGEIWVEKGDFRGNLGGF